MLQKDTTQELQEERDAIGKLCGKGHRASMVSGHAILPKSSRGHQPGKSRKSVLWGCYGGMNDYIIGCRWLNLISSHSALPTVLGGTKCLNPVINSWFPW